MVVVKDLTLFFATSTLFLLKMDRVKVIGEVLERK